MCSIFGAVGFNLNMAIVDALRESSGDRGRDGGRYERYSLNHGLTAVLGNWRATPTPEVEKAPLQPYERVVHNGTIANDKELGIREGEVDSMILRRVLSWNSIEDFVTSLGQVVGSYALAGVDDRDRKLFLACNYKPIHFWSPDGHNFYFSSMARHFRKILKWYEEPRQMAPYSVLELPSGLNMKLPRLYEKRAVVIASAGLDSTTVAADLVHKGYDVCLLHFLYNCHAQRREMELIPQIAEALDTKYEFIDLNYDAMAASPLLEEGADIAECIQGAEYAHEWVPARNLVMLSMAAAYAEANGFHEIALGNNLEESGAYPDNEEQMTCLMDEVMDYAVQNGYEMRVISPVGHLMKHEIVKLGVELGAPYHLTWSCYRGEDRHCGQCGPCFMRKTAFERNGLKDPVFEALPYGVEDVDA